jgi:hypothetical protein
MPRLVRIALTGVAALAVIYAIVATWRQNDRAAGLDFYIYFVNAQLAGRSDIANIYDRDEQSRIGEEYYERAQQGSSELRKYDAQRRRFLDSVSSPFLYTTLGWVSRDYDRALQQYHVVVFVAFVLGLLFVARAVRLSAPLSLLVLAALLLWYRGFEADLRVGNVNSLQLLLVGAALLAPPGVAGAILGVLLAFKPNLLLIPLLIAVARIAAGNWSRLRREMIGGAVGVVIAIVAAAIRYGSATVWLQWVARANEFYHRLPTRVERNVTPLLEVFQQYGARWSYATALLLTLIVVVAIWRGKGRADDALLAGVAILIYLLSATVVWLHYMVLVVPVALALMRWRSTALVALVALAAIAEEPWEMLTGIAVYPNDAKLLGPAFAALFACAIWKIAKPEPSTAPPRHSSAPHPERAVA